MIELTPEQIAQCGPATTEHPKPEGIASEHATPAQPPSVDEASFPSFQKMKDPIHRWVVRDSVYHQPCDRQGFSYHFDFNHGTLCDEDPYIRHLKISDRPKALDKAWIAKCGMLIIENKADPEPLADVLSPERRAKHYAKTVEVYQTITLEDSTQRTMHSPPISQIRVKVTDVPPGHSVRLFGLDPETLLLCCPQDEVRVAVYVFPY